MTETDTSPQTQPPPQISEMFHKFALAFKTKTIEFFAEDEDDLTTTRPQSPEPEFLSLLDSTEEFITNQRVVVIKPDSTPSQPDPTPTPTPFPSHLRPTLISTLFATISSFEAAYLHLQTSHSPLNPENISSADRSAVSSLQKLSQLKNCYKNYNPNPTSPLAASPLEARVNENQSVLRTLEMLVNRLQSEFEAKDSEVKTLKYKLRNINELNSKLSNNLLDNKFSEEVFLSVRVFATVLRYVCKLSYRFTKLLIELMRNVGWDLDSAASSVYCDVMYGKSRHCRYAFLSYVCLGMFQGFDLERFGLEGGGGGDCGVELRRNSLREFVEHGTGDAMEILGKDVGCCFARFCETKYEQLIHPTMESSLFRNLEKNEVVLSSWRSSAAFYESFVEMASGIWMLHKLAFAFDPVVDIFQVDRGVDFSMVYMESVTGKGVLPGKIKPKVGFTVIPGFKIGKTVIQSKVYLSGSKSEE